MRYNEKTNSNRVQEVTKLVHLCLQSLNQNERLHWPREVGKGKSKECTAIDGEAFTIPLTSEQVKAGRAFELHLKQ